MTDINAHSKNMDKTNKVNTCIYMNIKIKTYHQATCSTWDCNCVYIYNKLEKNNGIIVVNSYRQQMFEYIN